MRSGWTTAGALDSVGPTPGYFDSPWPAERGGPRRQKAPPTAPGNSAANYRSGPLSAASASNATIAPLVAAASLPPASVLITMPPLSWVKSTSSAAGSA